MFEPPDQYQLHAALLARDARFEGRAFVGATSTKGDVVSEARLESGFPSPSAFRAAFAQLMGQAPESLDHGALLRADWIDTPLGPMVAICDQRALHLLEFIDRRALPASLKRLQRITGSGLGFGRFAPTEQIEGELGAFFAGESARFDTPLVLHGSAFTREVWHALREIPAGETRSYSALAHSLGRPGAARAVAGANGANQLALVIPCHRLLGADGSLTGYGGGLWRKQRLIELERRFLEEEEPL